MALNYGTRQAFITFPPLMNDAQLRADISSQTLFIMSNGSLISQISLAVPVSMVTRIISNLIPDTNYTFEVSV